MNVDALDTMWIWSAGNTSTPQSPIAAPAPSARPPAQPGPVSLRPAPAPAAARGIRAPLQWTA
ncbi:hypothetical protein EDF60_2265 [Leucobacter luti]|nr:hypothetical protein [Leucobacter luti]TCK39809.1 hypothetical protein EDF60_2265 [Leucobacter luti]